MFPRFVFALFPILALTTTSLYPSTATASPSKPAQAQKTSASRTPPPQKAVKAVAAKPTTKTAAKAVPDKRGAKASPAKAKPQPTATRSGKSIGGKTKVAAKPARTHVVVAKLHVSPRQPSPAHNLAEETGSVPQRGLGVQSASVLVVDDYGEEIFVKAPDHQHPIASITKLMTAVVVLDADLPMDEEITISAADRDGIRQSSSRLHDGTATLSRRDLLHIALMASENRAAAALARTTFPGGTPEFVMAMNRKARALGMVNTQFADGTGLDGRNVSTARDLVKLLRAAYNYDLIREATTTRSAEVYPYGEQHHALNYVNTNRLVRSDDWEIELSKTGYLNEAGRCLAMRTRIADRPLYMVFLHGPGKLTPFGDSYRLRKWLQTQG